MHCTQAPNPPSIPRSHLVPKAGTIAYPGTMVLCHQRRAQHPRTLCPARALTRWECTRSTRRRAGGDSSDQAEADADSAERARRPAARLQDAKLPRPLSLRRGVLLGLDYATKSPMLAAKECTPRGTLADHCAPALVGIHLADPAPLSCLCLLPNSRGATFLERWAWLPSTARKTRRMAGPAKSSPRPALDPSIPTKL